VGGFDDRVPARDEPKVKYHPVYVCGLTLIPVNPGSGQWVPGSLTGAVSSKRVTEERKGRLSTDGNRVSSVRAQAGFTVRRLKWYASWVQTGVSQVGPYLLWALQA